MIDRISILTVYIYMLKTKQKKIQQLHANCPKWRQRGSLRKHFPNGFLPSSNFPRVFLLSGNFPYEQLPKRQLPKSILAAALGPLAHHSRSTFCSTQPLGSFQLGNCNLGSRPWENAFGKDSNTLRTTCTIPLTYVGKIELHVQSL